MQFLKIAAVTKKWIPVCRIFENDQLNYSRLQLYDFRMIKFLQRGEVVIEFLRSQIKLSNCVYARQFKIIFCQKMHFFHLLSVPLAWYLLLRTLPNYDIFYKNSLRTCVSSCGNTEKLAQVITCIFMLKIDMQGVFKSVKMRFLLAAN